MPKIPQRIIYLILAFAVLGFILTRQFYLQEKVKKITQPEQEKELALEVSQLIKSNKELQKQLAKLNTQYETLHQKTQNRQNAESSLRNSINEYQIITGAIPVEGPGIILETAEDLSTTQITDLVNALKNIGAEAIEINGIRLTPTLGWDATTFKSPYHIEAIGDGRLLKDSLERRGGILEQIGVSVAIKIQNELHLAAGK